MKQHKTVFLSILLFLITFVYQYTSEINHENDELIHGLSIARSLIDADSINSIHQRIVNGEDRFNISQSVEYQKIVKSLLKLNDSFELDSKWTYIIEPKVDNNHTKFIVLTVPPVSNISSTLPGFDYDTSNYPAMKQILTSANDYTVSDIVWDYEYKILTRSGFIKIYSGKVCIGILGVDLDMSQIISTIFNSIIVTIIYSSILLLIFFSIIDKYRPTEAQLELLESATKESK